MANHELAEKMLSDLLATPDNPSRMGRLNKLIQPGSSIHTRLVPDVEVPDVESMPVTYLLTALMHLAKQFGRLEKKVADTSRYVDEYIPNNSSSAIISGTPLEVLPIYDQIPELIHSVVITGPPAGTVSLQLGDRFWSLVIPSTGILTIGPMLLMLSHQDRRLLTPTATGNYTLELQGWADERFVS